MDMDMENQERAMLEAESKEEEMLEAESAEGVLSISRVGRDILRRIEMLEAESSSEAMQLQDDFEREVEEMRRVQYIEDHFARLVEPTRPPVQVVESEFEGLAEEVITQFLQSEPYMAWRFPEPGVFSDSDSETGEQFISEPLATAAQPPTEMTADRRSRSLT